MSSPAAPTQQGLYCVLGDPIAHSLSPLIHNGWMLDHGLNERYAGIHVPEGDLASALEKLATRGLAGVNITLPHKQAALELAESASEVAKSIGAANTLIRKTNLRWHAENTDAPGFLEALADFYPDPLMGKHVFLLGAGGAARAVMHALDGAGAHVIVCNRTREKAQDLIRRYEPGMHHALTLEAGLAALDKPELVINTTSLGHAGEAFDWPDGEGRPLYDISYGKTAEVFLAPARAKNWQTADGLGMLVAQAALSFEMWFGIKPGREIAMTRCKTALEKNT
ncbi:MAG: shikimate dehydrogenase [Hyphomonadaceae bacterium]